MHPLINIAVRAARAAGSIITRHVDRVDRLTISVKERNDFVSEVDALAEEAIISVVQRAYPDHAILAEESGAHGEGEFTWIIDPLDGTTNFLHGFPQFAVSIGIERQGRLEHGVVYDPMRQELFTASRGEGAHLNHRRLRVTRQRGLEGALLGTGFPFKDQEYLDPYLATFKALVRDTAGIRRPGSAALDLAWVAAGRLDGFWEIGLKPWDMAGGVVLIQEAGGLVGDFIGGDHYMSSGNLVAGTPRVYEAILKEIDPLLPAELRR